MLLYNYRINKKTPHLLVNLLHLQHKDFRQGCINIAI